MKKSTIFGTAGHIDHGKSSLVKALTGKDPDRLKEEKEKGITIELGFAGMETEQNKISFVDVPGHEGLIKTMISGSVGFDSVLFCVDGREGIRAQTIEHFNIIRTIGIKRCVAAITKSDICTDEQMKTTEESVKELFENSGITISSMVRTSIADQKSIQALKEAVNECASKTHPKQQKRCYVIRVDRVFSVKGSGTVVTGTSIFGKVTRDTLIFNTKNKKHARVKDIQVHDKSVEKSVAGERTALNLPDFKINDIQKGDILSDNEKIESVKGIYAGMTVFDGQSEKTVLKHNRIYSVFIGAVSCEGKLIMLDSKKLRPGESSNCLIKLNKEITPYFDEPIIIRAGNPQVSIAGGRVLGLEKTYPGKKQAKEILPLLARHDFEGALKKIVKVYYCGLKLPEPIQFSGLIRNELAFKLAQLNIANFKGFILDSKNLENFVENTIKLLGSTGSLAINKIQHTCEKLPEPVRFDIINRIIDRAQKQNYVFDGHILKKKEKDPFEEISMGILNHMKTEPSLSNPAMLAEKTGLETAKVQKCLQYLCNRSLVKNIEGNNHVPMELLNSFVEKAESEAADGTPVDLGVMKKHFDLPRKLLVPMMEQLDKTGLFINRDNKRFLKKD